jgi:cytidine deaminase
VTITAEERQLLESEARAAASQAWAPYSKFHVGAALLSDDGRVFSGCNVENASYGATVCAERNAIGTAVRAGARRFVACVVFVETSEPAMPCGICRQVLAEFADSLEIIAVSAGGHEEHTTLDALLPRRFSGADISKERPSDG